MPSPLFALLIGVDKYKAPFIPALKGCRNDVELIASVLRNRFGLDDQHLHLLHDEEATHDGIVQAIRSHLIENARAAKAAGQSDLACLLHFSGHGSMARNEDKTAGLDETIVPHDSRLEGIVDIKDWELGSLIDELAQYTSNITVVLDCCHSGSGTRDEETVVRQCPTDLRPQPERPIRTGTRGDAPASDGNLNTHVLLAACSNSQTANEYVDQSTGEKRYFGILSYSLAEELAKATSLTYRELHQRVCRRVWQSYPLQSPQCEGDRDRLLFGGVRPPQDLWIRVVGPQDGLIKIDAGSAHGLSQGAELDVYEESVRTRSSEDRPIARLRVTERNAVWSLCETVEGTPLPGSRVEPTTCGVDLLRTVSLCRASESVRTDLRSRLEQQGGQGLIRVVDDPNADLRLLGSLNGDIVCDSMLTPLEAMGTSNPELLVQQIRKWARYQNALRIENASPRSELSGKVSIEFKLKDGTLLDGSGHPVLESGTVVQVQMSNQSTVPLYLCAMSFGYDGSISLIWPAMAGEKLTVPPGKSVTTRAFRLAFAAGEPRVEVREAIKVFATRSPTEFDLLTMDGSGNHSGTRSASSGPLGQLLEQAAQGSGTRILEPVESAPEEDWTAAELRYHLVRPTKELQRPITGGQAVSIPGSDLVLTAPAGFTGTVTGQALSTGLRSPESLSTATFAAALSNAQLIQSFEIQADSLARSQVSPASPLQITLPTGQRAADSSLHVVMASDGELFYPAGVSREGTSAIDVIALPPAVDPAEGPGTRGLAQSIRLYIYKVMNWDTGELGMQRLSWVSSSAQAFASRQVGERSRRFASGETRGRLAVPNDFPPESRILVLVHGALSDGSAMLANLFPLLDKSGQTYDQIIAFEYETFATPVQQNVTRLAQSLSALGVRPGQNGRVDLIAEGLGTLVARGAVELLGAHDRISRCLLAGPMNLGTLLAKSQSLVTWLGASAMFKTLTVPYLVPLCAGLAKIASDAAVLKDLQPQSEFLKALNGSNPPQQVPYTILAGSAELPVPLSNIARRLADPILTQLFNDVHDLVVSQKSMVTIRDGRVAADRLTVHFVPADHFSYWTEPQSAELVVNWFKQGLT